MWHKRARNRGVANIQISPKTLLFVPSLHFQKSNPSTADPWRLLNFLSMPIQARMTWLGGSSNTTVQHFILYTIVHYCTLPKWAEAQWVIESLRAKAEKSSNFRSMSVEMTWLCSKPLVLVVQEQSHWPTINYHLMLCSSSALMQCTLYILTCVNSKQYIERHWPTINYHLTLCSSSALLQCTSRLVSIAIDRESLTNYWLSPPHCVPQLFLTAWTRAICTSWFCQ